METTLKVIINLDFNIADVNIQTSEVSEVKWFSYEAFKKLIDSEEHVPLNSSLKDILLQIIEENLHK